MLAIMICNLSALLIPCAVLAQQEVLANSGVPKGPNVQAELGASKREEYIKRRMYENELMNQRLNWLLASQTLLFAGYGTVLNASLQRQVKELVARTAVTLGSASAFLIWLGIIAAIGASIQLTERFGDKEFSSGLLAWTNLLGWSVPFLLPILFIGAWIKLPTRGLASQPSSDQPVLDDSFRPKREPQKKQRGG
jgi:hypothetical protein